MSSELKISAGQCSERGRKEVNQDFHGLYVPVQPLLDTKGIAIALADGIGSSAVSDIASQAAVGGFLEDYYCTSDAWSVKTSAERVLAAVNSWLHAQTQQSQGRYDKDRGYVCTFSALVLKSATAHLFHVGDARIFRLSGQSLEQLTTDHRIWVSPGQSHLGRALGVGPRVEIDYQALQVEVGDVFVLATDGVHEYVEADFVAGAIAAALAVPGVDLDTAAQEIVAEAARRGSPDNLTVQIIRIDALPERGADEIQQQLAGLQLPPLLEARMDFDGYRIVKELHASSRSHVYLAVDNDTGEKVALKIPSIDLRGDPLYLERFMLEEWVARRIDNAHVLKAGTPVRKRNYLYVASEFIDGQSLAQWMIDHPAPALETVRGIVEQIARGLLAFHRLEMLHQDLRPANILIDATGTVKIIDFASARVAGLAETAPPGTDEDILGTAQYTAPEYFLGEGGSPRSDLFSLGVIAYQMLTGRLPYGAEVAKARSRAAQRRLRYDCAQGD
ncbi:MAG TPA: bifunctional protein-serine/threonine kinase/phosphatase, partial [Burkholderiales bacterium]|nr:bifunctional protein-serine/threonine kinase/phosphatase [Burkholderiales bacterium]